MPIVAFVSPSAGNPNSSYALDVSADNPLPVTITSGGTDQDVNLVGINGVAPSATNPLSTTSPQNRPQVTLSLETSAYSSGDVIADTQVITDALRVVGGTGTLQSLHVYDQDDQKAAFTVYLLRSNVSMGTENSAPSITDANALEILGWVSIAVGDYQDLGGVSVAQGIFSPFVLKSADASRDLYVAVVNGTGTPTYTASGVKLQFGISQD